MGLFSASPARAGGGANQANAWERERQNRDRTLDLRYLGNYVVDALSTGARANTLITSDSKSLIRNGLARYPSTCIGPL